MKAVLLAIHQAYYLPARNADQGIMRVWDIAVKLTGLALPAQLIHATLALHLLSLSMELALPYVSSHARIAGPFQISAQNV